MNAEFILNKFHDAAATLALLPNPRPGGFRSCMPETVREHVESFGTEAARQKFDEKARPIPTAEAIDELDKTLAWCLRLNEKERKILWAGGCGATDVFIAGRMKLHRGTVARHRKKAVNKIIDEIVRS